MSKKAARPDAPVRWRQNSLDFALADLRSNWPRWLFWAAVLVGITAAIGAVVGSDPHPRNPPPDPRLYWPLMFLAALVVQFLSALLLWSVELGAEGVRLGFGRNSRHYRLKKIARVGLAPAVETPSMLLEFESGKRVRVFIDLEKIPLRDLKKYFSSAGISVASQG